jgi:hypothetical protein
MKLYRNYDGNKSAFGDTSIQTTVPNPDTLAAFSSVRSSDNALTIMVVSKYLAGNTPVTMNIGNFAHGATAQMWQLTAANAITRLSDISFSGNSLTTTLPLQSITLFVIPAGSGSPSPTPTPTPTPAPTPTPTPTPSPTPTPTPVVPNAPSNLGAAAESPSRINLNWIDNSTNETGFRVERCSGAGCTNFAQIATVNSNVSSYANTGLRKNTTYTYRVRAYTTSANSAYSNTATAKTPRK